MTKFQNLIAQLDITRNITDEDIEKTITLLNLYGPTLRRAGRNIDELEEECFESRRQSVSDFINLAIDFDHDADRKHIADRLSEMGHSMQLLNIMEDALVLLKSEPVKKPAPVVSPKPQVKQEQTDELSEETVAVITAAIMAYYQKTNPKCEFTVKRIKRI